MIEPRFDVDGELVPFSLLCRADLEHIATGDIHAIENHPDCDVDFAIAYARRLLRERT
jgi:hypothetical protein